MSLLNIISVTKDDLKGVQRTVESTKALRRNPFVRQLIIDGSSEDIRTSVKDLAYSGENLDYFWQEPSGISAAFNKGLSFVESEWVWFLNGGDEVHSHFKPNNLLYLLNESNADAIIFQNEWKGTGKRIKHPPLWAMWPPLFSWIPHPSTLTRRTIYNQYGNFDERFEIAMDYEFWIRCFSKNVVVDTLSIPLTKYDPCGISSTQPKKVSREAVRILRFHMWNIVKIWIKNGFILPKAYYNYSRKTNK
jgi:glycosyltransferase involved in cell wall biosynthesis